MKVYVCMVDEAGWNQVKAVLGDRAAAQGWIEGWAVERGATLDGGPHEGRTVAFCRVFGENTQAEVQAWEV